MVPGTFIGSNYIGEQQTQQQELYNQMLRLEYKMDMILNIISHQSETFGLKTDLLATKLDSLHNDIQWLKDMQLQSDMLKK